MKFSKLASVYNHLIYRFDCAFYLICNPDVANYLAGPFAHWKKYGVQECRTFSPKNCFASDFYISNDKVCSITKDFDDLISSKISKIQGCKVYQIPWRPGIAGFPSKIISIKLKLKGSPANENLMTKDCSLMLRRRFMNNYEILLNYSRL